MSQVYKDKDLEWPLLISTSGSTTQQKNIQF